MSYETIDFTDKGFIWAKEKIITTEPIVWHCPIDIGRLWRSKDGRLVIDRNVWYIVTGFKYDGCSNVSSGPKYPKPELLPVKSLTEQPIGILWFACLIHDIGYKYLIEDDFPFNKDQVDKFLELLCRQARWKYSKLYYIGVSILGWGALLKKYIKSKLKDTTK